MNDVAGHDSEIVHGKRINSDSIEKDMSISQLSTAHF